MSKRIKDDKQLQPEIDNVKDTIIRSYHMDIQRMLNQVQAIVRNNETIIDKLSNLVDGLEDVYQKTFPKEFWKHVDNMEDDDDDYIEEEDDEYVITKK